MHNLNAFIVEADGEGCEGSPLDVVFFKQDGELWQTGKRGPPRSHSPGCSCSLFWTNTGLQSPNCKHENQTAHRGIQPQDDSFCPFREPDGQGWKSDTPTMGKIQRTDKKRLGFVRQGLFLTAYTSCILWHSDYCAVIS